MVAVADTLSIPEVDGIKTELRLPCLFNCISRDGEDIEGATGWMRKLLDPAIAVAKARKEAVKRRSESAPVDPVRERQLRILDSMAASNAIGLANAARRDDPYSAPTQPLPVLLASRLAPGSEMMARLLLAPGLSTALLESVNAAVLPSQTSPSNLDSGPLPDLALEYGSGSQPVPSRKRPRRSGTPPPVPGSSHLPPVRG
ncbi:hypothetical protein DFH06DRAFT_211733 [Mycena polygramma]|nr:hypothetical protein DFH06DRAFT_211733 [Mycena polygramma]